MTTTYRMPKLWRSPRVSREPLSKNSSLQNHRHNCCFRAEHFQQTQRHVKGWYHVSKRYVTCPYSPLHFWAIARASSLRRFTARDIIHVLTNTGKTFTWRRSPNFGQHWHSIRNHVVWGTNTQLAYTDHCRRRSHSIWDKRGWHPWHCIRYHVTRVTNTQLAYTGRQTVQLWINVVG